MESVTTRKTKNGVTVYEVPGYPGLRKLGGGHWFIQDGRYRIKLGVHTTKAAMQLYVQREIDPEGFMPPQKTAYHKRTVTEVTKEYEAARDDWKNRDAFICRLLREKFGSEKYIKPHDSFRFAADLCSGKAKSTARANQTTLKRIGKWMTLMGYWKANPFDNIPLSQIPKKDPKQVIEWEILERYENYLPNWLNNSLRVLWALGLRYQELRRLKTSSIRRSGTELFIQKSKNRSRTIPIPDEYVELAIREVCISGVKTKSAICGQLKSARQKDPTLPYFHLHQLRHSRITLWLMEGCNPLDVMRWAGHSNIQTTMQYVGEANKCVKLPGKTPLVKNGVVGSTQ